MTLFALAHLMPEGKAQRAAVRTELTARHRALLAPLRVEPPGGNDAQYYALIDLADVVTACHGPGAGFGGLTWDVRVCLAALTLDELAAVGSAIRAVVDRLVTG